jgi:two-component system, NtrC family, sensor kinase
MKPKEELIGGNIGSIWLNEANAAKQHAAIGEVFATGENRQLVYSLTISNSEIWLSTGYSLIAGGTGKTPAVLAISRDVTERKRTEERMYHTEKLASLGTLAAGVAHEINNPLAVILGFTDILLEKAPQDSESSEMLKTIEKQANNAKRVVENLLSFARYRDIKEELVDINESIEEVLRVVGNSLRVNRVTVVKHLAWDLPRFKGDSRQIEQVVLNIINNAVYAMKGSGALTIATGTAEIGNSVEIRITDTGTGIKKEHRGKIFDPLFTTKGVGEGTGLGLSVCYAIVSKYGGSITFETRTADEGPPVGTTFIVTLPAAKWGDQEKQRVDGEHWKVFS